MTRDALLKKIERIKDLNKQQVTQDRLDHLKQVYDHLKILDAQAIAQGMLYAKQDIFDF